MLIPDWGDILDRVAGEPVLAEARTEFLAMARGMAAMPIVRRVYRYEEIGMQRTWLDNRSVVLEPEIQTTFALAMSDHGTNNLLANELPVLAAAYRLTGDVAFQSRLGEQLAEMIGWSPLQRPGWTCYQPGNRLPADGQDGAWLATGTGVRAIADTLEILPPGAFPASLYAQLEALFEREIAQVIDDWQTRRPWFVLADNPITNQWVLPTEGLIRACLVLGPARFAEALAIGVGNMQRSLDAHGSQGEFEEGYHYAAFTVSSMLSAARALARAGDRRLLEHPFLQHFPTWLIHNLQPQRLLINAFDCFTNSAPRRMEQADLNRGVPMLDLLACCAVATSSPVACWAVNNLFDGPPVSLADLAARALPAADTAPPPAFAAYRRATRVNWRSSWADDASGIWIRGGHADDQHDHQDRGHISLTLHGLPVLIETGTPAYHHPRLSTHFSSGLGHNVLQVGGVVLPEDAPCEEPLLPGWQRPRAIAPITVHRLDETGGDITVDADGCYDEVDAWRRTVVWNADNAVIHDLVELSETNIVIFRWHLATDREVIITPTASGWEVRWDDVRLTLTASTPLTVTQEWRENHSLAQRHWDDPSPYPTHCCLVVRTAAARRFEIHTSIYRERGSECL